MVLLTKHSTHISNIWIFLNLECRFGNDDKSVFPIHSSDYLIFSHFRHVTRKRRHRASNNANFSFVTSIKKRMPLFLIFMSVVPSADCCISKWDDDTIFVTALPVTDTAQNAYDRADNVTERHRKQCNSHQQHQIVLNNNNNSSSLSVIFTAAPGSHHKQSERHEKEKTQEIMNEWIFFLPCRHTKASERLTNTHTKKLFVSFTRECASIVLGSVNSLHLITTGIHTPKTQCTEEILLYCADLMRWT